MSLQRAPRAEAKCREGSPGNESPLSSTAERIEGVFLRHLDGLARVLDISRRIRARIEEIDAFIEESSSEVCSRCEKKCCIDRYSYYNCDDLIYIYALGLRPLPRAGSDSSGACHFLSAGGCTLERAVRPSGCNWHFCDALTRRMRGAPGSAYGDFGDSMEEMMELWMELIREFRQRFREFTGEEMNSAELVCASGVSAYRSDF